MTELNIGQSDICEMETYLKELTVVILARVFYSELLARVLISQALSVGAAVSNLGPHPRGQGGAEQGARVRRR